MGEFFGFFSSVSVTSAVRTENIAAAFNPVILLCFLPNTASTPDTWDELDTHALQLHSVSAQGMTICFVFLPQGLYCEHSRSDSCLQTRVGAGNVVSNKQPLEPQWLSTAWYTTINVLTDSLLYWGTSLRQCWFILPPAGMKMHAHMPTQHKARV